MPFLARLKPLNERKGHKVKLYMIAGARFYVERGWYEVDDALADKLRDLHQDHYDLESPMLFDVCTEEEALRLEQSERAAAATARATVAQPASPRIQSQKPAAFSTHDLAESNPDKGRMEQIGRRAVEEPMPKSGRGPKTRSRR